MSNKKNRVALYSLEDLGKMLKTIDRHTVSTLAKRMKLASLVEKVKRLEAIEKKEPPQPIIRKDTEEKRINEATQWAIKAGINPNLAQTIQYLAIQESCKVQMAEREIGLSRDEETLYNESKENWLMHLRNNLLKLTARVAKDYDQMYGEDTDFGLKTYLECEQKIINQEIIALKAFGQNNLALDLGCANGRLTFELAKHFQKTIGIDISPDMIEAAHIKMQKLNPQANIEFQLEDLDQGLSDLKNCVSLAVANMGTASEINNLRVFLNNLSAALCPDGRFVLSFYNSNALYHKCFAPWQLPLPAEFDMKRHCLNVNLSQRKSNNSQQFQDNEPYYKPDNYLIYARPYNINEIKELCIKSNLYIDEKKIITYPTIASLLPQECCDDEQVQKTIKMLDDKLLTAESGAYIIVTGRKIK